MALLLFAAQAELMNSVFTRQDQIISAAGSADENFMFFRIAIVLVFATLFLYSSIFTILTGFVAFNRNLSNGFIKTVAMIQVFGFPIGTALGIYTIFTLSGRKLS